MSPKDNLEGRFSIRGWLGRKAAESPADGAVLGPRKWLPVIDTESCGGCGRCVDVCADRCIEMVWSFATLAQPGHCTSEGRCEAVCPEDVIRMEWVVLEDDHGKGRWDE